MDKQTYILVPKVWLEELVKESNKVDSLIDNFRVDKSLDGIRKAVQLINLIEKCKSAQTILNHNEKVVK